MQNAHRIRPTIVSWCHAALKIKQKMADKPICTHIFPTTLRQGKNPTMLDKLFTPMLLPQAWDNNNKKMTKPTTLFTIYSPGRKGKIWWWKICASSFFSTWRPLFMEVRISYLCSCSDDGSDTELQPGHTHMASCCTSHHPWPKLGQPQSLDCWGVFWKTQMYLTTSLKGHMISLSYFQFCAWWYWLCL